MKSNVGGIDRIARIVIGAVLVILAVTGQVGAWGWIGLLPLATGTGLVPTVQHSGHQHLQEPQPARMIPRRCRSL